MGKICLLGVAALWGSYTVSLRLIYSMDGAPGPVVIMLLRGVLQSVALVTANGLIMRGNSGSTSDSDTEGMTPQEEQEEAELVWKGGLELGLWNFLAAAIQVELGRLLQYLVHVQASSHQSWLHHQASKLPHTFISTYMD